VEPLLVALEADQVGQVSKNRRKPGAIAFGLSELSEELAEEEVVPSGAFELALDRTGTVKLARGGLRAGGEAATGRA